MGLTRYDSHCSLKAFRMFFESPSAVVIMIFVQRIPVIPLCASKLADGVQGLMAIHLGHHDVKTDKIVARPVVESDLEGLESLPPVHSDVAVAIAGEEFAQDLSC